MCLLDALIRSSGKITAFDVKVHVLKTDTPCYLSSMPCRMSHASIPAHVRAEREFPEDLIRLCVGIEDPDDLLEDLQMAITAAGAMPVENHKKQM